MQTGTGKLANVAIAIAAIAVASGVVYDTFIRPPGRAIAGNPFAPPEYVEGWERLSTVGLRIGSDSAPVQIVEFIDLECPFCATFEESIQPILREYPQSVTRTLIHFPVSMHSQARRAAQVFECGAQYTDPNAMLQALYRRQREYGEDAWIKAARDAGVVDTARFRECVARSEAHARIDAGYQLSRALDIGGTPTVIINGLLYPSPPTDSVMRTVISEALSGEPAASSKRKRPTRRVLEEWLVPLSPAEQSR